MLEQNYWRKCIVCKKEINFSTKYYKCSVSSCDKKRSPAQFCSVECWDIHRSIMSHKSAGADEYHSPSKSQWLSLQDSEPKVRIVKQQDKPSLNDASKEVVDDILVVVSKMKTYVKAKSGLNVSADVNKALSDIIRQACDDAMVKAQRDGRKTMMARDFR